METHGSTVLTDNTAKALIITLLKMLNEVRGVRDQRGEIRDHKPGEISYHSPGIRNHKPWDWDQMYIICILMVCQRIAHTCIGTA